MTKRALICVDPQFDFIEGGALAVAGGANALIHAAFAADRGPYLDGKGPYLCRIATRDFHPANHGSFASVAKVPLFSTFKLNGLNQVAWPDHCVQGTHGSEILPVIANLMDSIVPKGTDPSVDSYSGFFDNGHRNTTLLNQILLNLGITDLDICGLATDYCVSWTVRDALMLGYKVRVISKACAAVGGLAAHDAALAELRNLGAEIL